MGDGVVHELRVRLHVHLAENARAVRADRVGAEEKLVGDLPHRLAGGDHPHHLVLAVGKRLVQRLAAVVFQLDREHLPEALADHRVIVCDDDFHFRHALCRIGIDTDTRVPWPAVPLIFTSPPKSSARSCMPRSPSDFLPFRSLSAMPTPLSVTSSATRSSLTLRSRSTRVARECRATLVRISWKMRNIVVEMSMSSLTVSGGSF